MFQGKQFFVRGAKFYMCSHRRHTRNVKTQQEPNKKNYIGYLKAVYSRSGLLSL